MGYSIPSLVHFEQLYDPIKKSYFSNYLFEIIANYRMKNELFSTQAIQKILSVLHSSYPGDTPYQVWFNLSNSMTESKRPIFKIIYLI